MHCRRTIFALGVYLTIGSSIAFGQGGRSESPTSGSRPVSAWLSDAPPGYAGAAVMPTGFYNSETIRPVPTSESGPGSVLPGYLTQPASEWSLGEYPPTTKYVAGELYPPGQSVGWYAGFEIGIMKPHLRSSLTTPPGFAGPAGKAIAMPTGRLDWAGVPEFTLGYRLGQGAGELRLRYRLLNSSGEDVVSGAGLGSLTPLPIRTRLNLQTVDFDYLMPQYLSEGSDIVGCLFRDIGGGIGIRTVAAYFDSKGSGFPTTDAHVSSAFGGIGPRGFIAWHQDLGRPDFQFYTQSSASGILGPILQKFSETTLAGGVPSSGFYDTHNKNIGMGVFQTEAGFSWAPLALQRRLRITAAYSWERWWNFGRTDDSNAELTLQGVLLRAEFRY